ncbi:MAG TPA: 4Fe-4S binding protein [Candidatus Fermentibacter daniensis]|nr:4Fe-4S binding protein [Candidatus Fermentibacter daniensis]
MRSIAMSFILIAAASAGLSFSVDTGRPVVSWDAADASWDHLELRISSAPFDAEAPGTGIVVALIHADSLTGEFPTGMEIPGGFAVEPGVCIGCGLCAGSCPVGAITLTDGKAVIDPAACISCGMCANSCPVSAILAANDSAHFALFGIDGEGAATLLESI